MRFNASLGIDFSEWTHPKLSREQPGPVQKPAKKPAARNTASSARNNSQKTSLGFSNTEPRIRTQKDYEVNLHS